MSAVPAPYPRLTGPSKEGVFMCYLGENENRITFDYMKAFHLLLDRIEQHKGPTACVIYGQGKHFCNGLLMEELVDYPTDLLRQFHKLLRRLLSFPVPLVAAINGHAFAGGAMLAWSCDYRVMNATRGFLCINEVHLGLPLTPGMVSVIQAKVNRCFWVSTCLAGRRWTATEALAARLVDKAAGGERDVLETGINLAASVASTGENRYVYGLLKQQIYAAELEKLDKEQESSDESMLAERLRQKKSKL